MGVCSGKNEELVLGLGADSVVDYTKNSITQLYANEAEGKKFKIVYDTATNSGHGEDYRAASKAILQSGGQYVAINGPLTSWIRYFIGFEESNTHLFLTKANTTDLEIIGKLSAGEGESKGFKPIIAARLSFGEESVREGFEKLQGRRTVGKIVFEMDTTNLTQSKE